MAFLREEIKAATIIIGSLLLLSVLVIIISGSKLLKKYDVYYTKVTNAAGLEVGAQVRVGGVRSGRVLDIEAPLEPGELVTIVIGVDKETPLYKGTTARISQIGFVGDIYLLLSVKSTEAGRIEPGATLPSVEAVEFSELMTELNDLGAQLDDLIHNVNRIFSDQNVEGFETLVKNTNAAILNASDSIDTMTNEIRETMAKTQGVLDGLKGYVDEGGDLDEVFEKAKADLDTANEMLRAFEESAEKMGEATERVGGAVDRQGRNIDEVMGNLNDTMRDLQDLLQTLKLRPWSVVHQEEQKKGEK